VATDHVPTDTPAANLLWNAGAISQESLLLKFLGNSREQANRAEPFAPQKETLKDMRLESADPLIVQSSPTASHTPAPRRIQTVPRGHRSPRPSATGKELNPGGERGAFSLKGLIISINVRILVGVGATTWRV
jgi:hypothetical protein